MFRILHAITYTLSNTQASTAAFGSSLYFLGFLILNGTMLPFFACIVHFTTNQAGITCPYFRLASSTLLNRNLLKPALLSSDLSKNRPPSGWFLSMAKRLSWYYYRPYSGILILLICPQELLRGYLMGRSVGGVYLSADIQYNGAVHVYTVSYALYPWFDLMLTLAVELWRRRISPMANRYPWR